MAISLHSCTDVGDPTDGGRSPRPIGGTAALDSGRPDATGPDADRVAVAWSGVEQWPTAEQQLRVSARHPRAGLCVVTAVGEIDLFTAPLLETALWTQLAAVPAHLIVDLTDLRFLAVCGVRCLLQTRDIAARVGRTQLHLAGLHNRRVARPLALTATAELFDTHLTLTVALAATVTKVS